MPLPSPRRRAAAAAAVLGTLATLLAACGGSSTSATTKPSSASSAPSSSAAKPGPAVFPTVSGKYGTKPTLRFSDAKPSTQLATKVLSEGAGATVTKGELLVVDYLGQVWGGKTFDNSYDRDEPLGTPIGVGQVIPGWDNALVGKKLGSRVLVVVPPADGYGDKGNADAGIKGTDTLAFVVDLVEAYPKTATGDTSAAVEKVSTAPVTVTGALGAEPKVAIAKGAAVPKAPSAVVLAKSTGAPVKPGLVVLQYEAYYYDNQIADSTFQRGFPLSVSLGTGDTTNPFEKLVGIPLGSRVLLTTPAQDNAGKKTGLAIVVDLVAEPGHAKASG